MSDRDAFLAAIRAAPADDAPRLVYADWLDEQGDPDLAEFIRLQVELDPLRRPDTDLDRWRRATIDRHPDRPVPDDFPADLHRYAALARRERELRDARQWEWLAPLAGVDEDYSAHLSVTFRRGLAEEVAIGTSAFLKSGEAVRQACPNLRRLTLYGPREQVPELVASAALHGIPELELAGWITEYDARFLAGWLAFNPVRSLTLWVGSQADAEVIRLLATGPTDGNQAAVGGQSPRLTTASYLCEMRELVLVQLYGGPLAGDPSSGLLRALRLTSAFNQLLGRGIARFEQPSERRFPLAREAGRGIYAGHLQNSPAVVSAGLRPYLLRFDDDGRFISEHPLELPGGQSGRATPVRETWSLSELRGASRDVRGFQPGTIFVWAFDAEQSGVSVRPWGTFEDVVADPDAQPAGQEQEEACAFLHQDCMRGGNFAIHSGADYWAGPYGTIHAS